MKNKLKCFIYETAYCLSFFLTMAFVILFFFSPNAYAETLQATIEGGIPQIGTKDLAVMGSTMVFDYFIGRSKKVKSNSILEVLFRIGKVFIVGLIHKNLKSWFVFALMLGTGLFAGCSSVDRKDAKEAVREHLKNSGKAFLCTEVIKKCADFKNENLSIEQ